MNKHIPLILGIILGVCFVVLALVIFIPSNKKPNKKIDVLYHNIDLRIVSINGDSSVPEDKITHPKDCNYILFETLGDEKLYMEINTCEIGDCSCRKIHIDRKWVYSHCAGDIVHFDYIRKDRFFKGHKKE